MKKYKNKKPNQHLVGFLKRDFTKRVLQISISRINKKYYGNKCAVNCSLVKD